MLGDYMQHQEEQHRSQSDLYFLKVQYAFWDLELDYRWRVKDGEASA